MVAEFRVDGIGTGAVPSGAPATDIVPAPRFKETRDASQTPMVEEARAPADDIGKYARALLVPESRFERAQVVRQTDARLQRVEASLESMRTNVEAIVKRYPPYSSADNERVEYLNQITGLRKQIEQLTFPPDNTDSAYADALGRARQSINESLGDEMALDGTPSDPALDALLTRLDGLITEMTSLREGIWDDLLVLRGSQSEGQVEADSQVVARQLGTMGATLGVNDEALRAMLGG